MERNGSSDNIDDYYRREAKRVVDRMPAGIREDIGALTLLERNVHLGVDAYGNRLTPNEIRIQRQTKEALRTKLAGKYTGGDELELSDFFDKYGAGNKNVQEELVRRQK